MNYSIQQILEEILGPNQGVNESTGQIRFDCPYCAIEKGLKDGKTDGKGNLEVNIESEYEGHKGVYKCWVCSESHGTHGSISRLISQLGNKGHYKRYLSELSQQDKDFILGRNNPSKVVKKISKGIKEIALYEEFKPAYIHSNDREFRKVFEYLNNRGITEDIISKFKLKYWDVYEKRDDVRSFHGRIIFPSFGADGKVNYFVARDYRGRANKYKYQNPEVEKEEIIFNEYYVNWDQDIYLVEGVTDHLVVPNSIPMLGKTISDLLYRTLQSKANGNIIIFLDADAFKDTLKLYDKLNINNLKNRVRFIQIEKLEGFDLDPSKINELWGRKILTQYMRSQRKKILKDKINVIS